MLFRSGLDRGDDRLDGDASVGDELAAGAPCRGGEGRRPEVLPDENPGSAAGVHGGGEVLDVVLGQQLCELGFDGLELAELLAEEDVVNLAAAMEPGSTAGVLIWENLWAAPFAAAARRSGGQLIANGRIPIQAIIASIEADDATMSEGA